MWQAKENLYSRLCRLSDNPRLLTAENVHMHLNEATVRIDDGIYQVVKNPLSFCWFKLFQIFERTERYIPTSTKWNRFQPSCCTLVSGDWRRRGFYMLSVSIDGRVQNESFTPQPDRKWTDKVVRQWSGAHMKQPTGMYTGAAEGPEVAVDF